MNSSKDEKLLSKKLKAKVIRPLGYLERFQAAMQWLGFYCSSMVTCRYALPATLSATLDQDPDAQAKLQQMVESAIAKILLDHPFLRVGVRAEYTRKPTFVELENVDLARHIEWRRFDGTADYEAEVLALIRAQLGVKVPQPADAPSWRIHALRTEGGGFLDVMFEWGHSQTDGMSAKIFHEELLRNLNGGPAVEELKGRVLAIPSSKRRDLLPPLDALVRFPVSPGYAVATLWEQLHLPGFTLDSKADLSAAWAPIRTLPYVARYRHFSIDNGALQNILAACRKHNTTLTGLIHALAHVSLATRLSAAQAPGFLSSTVVNLRPLMCAPETKTKVLKAVDEDPNRMMGNLLTSVDHEFSVDWVAKVRAAGTPQGARSGGEEGQESKSGSDNKKRIVGLKPLIWEAATSVRAVLQKRLDSGTRDDLMGLMRFIPDFRAMLRDWAKEPRRHTVAVTNLGVIDGAPSENKSVNADGKWNIERAVFSISPEAHGAVLTFCPMAVKGGDLYMSCDWQDCAVDATLAEGVVADLESWLRVFGH
ncbi:hypothetical protein F4804DRAFT_68660 [Jackrogersella minutella]|nr:hypothetical protein F4804DRAFT_68660 [Jackrogersella minutella]